jgi:hypothetical protein
VKPFFGESCFSCRFSAFVPKSLGECFDINRPKNSDFDLPSSREGQRGVIRPLAGARGYRKVQSSKDVGAKRRFYRLIFSYLCIRWSVRSAASVYLCASGVPPFGGDRKQRAKAPAGRFVTLPMLERGVMALPWGREVIAKIQG